MQIKRRLLKKIFNPASYYQAYKQSRKSSRITTTADNAQLALYAKLLPGGFLHYGYFDDPSTPPQEISLQDIYRAQRRYAELLVGQAQDKDSPVLDVGCGMGGLFGVLTENGFAPVGLTPDRTQIRFLKQHHPTVPLIETRFEEMPAESYQHHFGTVIHSESLQYMILDDAISMVKRVMKAEGRWIVSDYFRTGDSHEKSGLPWETFMEKLRQNRFRVVSETDMTANVCPTLAYLHMWGKNIGQPLLEFAIQKLRKKRPALYFWLEDIIESGQEYYTHQLKVVDPAVFSASKKYMLLTMERV